MKAIANKFYKLGGKTGVLGLPLGKTQNCASAPGRNRRFQKGMIYWHPKYGTHTVLENICEEWNRMGAEGGKLGYPTSDTLMAGDQKSLCNCFEQGRIYRSVSGETRVTDLNSDAAFTTWTMFHATPISPNWRDRYPACNLLPKKIDYSASADYARNQGTKNGYGLGGGGCPTFTLLHIMDILKDWEHPFSPATSWRYADWKNKEFQAQHGRPAEIEELANLGVASEARCPTNFDTRYEMVPDDQGNLVGRWHEPSQAAIDETPLYRVSAPRPSQTILCSGEDLSGTLQLMKTLLVTYGPLHSVGADHAKAIVGYDDDQQHFIILDSYPHEETGGRNITYVGYQDVGPGKTIDAFTRVSNLPSVGRINGKNAYTASISISTNWRGTYNVRVGVDGREPLTVYTTRGRDTLGYDLHLDHSRFLKIDVPLPDYAQDCWPPSESHKWFLEVEDCDRDGGEGTIIEFLVARRIKNSNCTCFGRYRSEVFKYIGLTAIPDPVSGPIAPPQTTTPTPGSAWPATTPNPNPGVARVYISPSSISLSIGARITMPTDLVSIEENRISLGGRLRRSQSNTPLPDKKVYILRLKMNTCINKKAAWEVLKTTETDQQGYFRCEITKTQPGGQMYTAVYIADGQVIASSFPLVFDNLPPVLISRIYWCDVLPSLLPFDIYELLP